MILLATHLGLGDMLVSNAIFQHYAAESIAVPCKRINIPSVKPLRTGKWLAPVENDADVVVLARHYPGRLLLGIFSQQTFDCDRWDAELYRQAGVPFEYRWERFVYPRPTHQAIERAQALGRFAFVHEDVERGFRMNPDYLPKLSLVRPDRNQTENIFDYVAALQAAEEIHCIDSCFAILVDSIPTTAKLFLHWYARMDKPPHYRKNWEVLT